MKVILGSRRHHYVVRVSIFLVMVALIAGMAGCAGPGPLPPKDLDIYNWNDLNDIRDNLGGHHKLMNNLDFNTDGYNDLASSLANDGKGWEPIGPSDEFSGILDGQGYKIQGLFINRPEVGGRVGLFCSIGVGGVVENIGVVYADVTGYDYVGALAAANGGTVSNCYATGIVTGNTAVGGLVGVNGGTVDSCYSTASVTGSSYVGGLVGGSSAVGTVSNSYSTGSVSGSTYVGGLMGRNSGGTISNSYSTGTVTGEDYVGGLMGDNQGGTVSNSFWDTDTSGQNGSAGGEGKTTAEMQDIATFAGWNIVLIGSYAGETWYIDDGNDYPRLGWQL
jgi:hypothetical protein